LGAGKTTLCRGVLQSLGFVGDVASPSYALIHQYLPPEVSIPVVHADLYRINALDELLELGLTDGSSDCINLIEWAERAKDLFGKPSHHITIELLPAGARNLVIETP
jgi:tRNA threonylcarbamoyladenosine biosynthesis protein TsaE